VRAAKPDATRQLGVLLASGLIVGESLLGVVFATIIAFSGNPAPIALVGKGFDTAGIWLGAIAFAALSYLLYRWVGRLAGRGRIAV
jgi:hypothetical protein